MDYEKQKQKLRKEIFVLRLKKKRILNQNQPRRRWFIGFLIIIILLLFILNSIGIITLPFF